MLIISAGWRKLLVVLSVGPVNSKWKYLEMVVGVSLNDSQGCQRLLGRKIMSLEFKILKFKIKLSVRRSKTKKVTSRNQSLQHKHRVITLRVMRFMKILYHKNKFQQESGSGTLTTFASRRHAEKQKITLWVIFLFFAWWLRSDLNQRHKALQASALPTELQSQAQIIISCRAENTTIS